MKHLVICILILACILFAGCTSAPAPASTPTPTTVPVTTITATATPQLSFSLGDHYLQKSYALQNESDVRTEEFRVDNSSWGIAFDVLPLNDNLQYCWFELTVSNMDSMQNETFGYGRDKSFLLHQQYPMYRTGPYKLIIKGAHVKVDVTAAKRNP